MNLLEKISWVRASRYAALISLGFLVAFGLLGIIGPVSFGKDAPAWVQAVGSIAAILVAVYVPWKQRKNVLRDEAARDVARIGVMATALTPALDDTRAALVTMLEWVDKDYDARKQMDRTVLLPRHPEYDQFRPDLYLFGDLAKTISIAISKQQYFQDAIEAMSKDPILLKAFKDKVRAEATDAIAVVTDARDKLKEITY